MYEPTRGGTRGDHAEFKWTGVFADKGREVRQIATGVAPATDSNAISTSASGGPSRPPAGPSKQHLQRRLFFILTTRTLIRMWQGERREETPKGRKESRQRGEEADRRIGMRATSDGIRGERDWERERERLDARKSRRDDRRGWD